MYVYMYMYVYVYMYKHIYNKAEFPTKPNESNRSLVTFPLVRTESEIKVCMMSTIS